MDQQSRHKTATVAEVFRLYVAAKAGTNAATGAETAWKRLGPFFGHLLPEAITPALCAEYVAYRVGQRWSLPTWKSSRKIKPATPARELIVLRAAIRWAVRSRMISDVASFALPPAAEPRDLYLTEEEAEALMAAAAPHIRLFTLIALSTAARTSAVLELKWAKVRDGYIDFRTPSEVRSNKRRGIVRIVTGSRLEQALDEARKARLTDWVIEYRRQRVEHIAFAFRGAVQRAGLPAGVTPHILKHTACVWMAQRGVPLADIAEYASTSIQTVMKHYLVYTPDRGARAGAALQGFSHV